MNLRTSLFGAALACTALVSCDKPQGADAGVGPEATPAARVSIPLTNSSFTAWPVVRYTPGTAWVPTQITYFLDGTVGSSTRALYREYFREWAVALTGRDMKVRFTESTNPDLANIKVSIGSATTSGCVDQNGTRYCDVSLKYSSDFMYQMGRTLGLPTSQTQGDVMFSGTYGGSLFTANDLAAISQVYGYKVGQILTPMFTAKYSNSTDSEVVIGWESMASRSLPAPVYVIRSSRHLVAGLVNGYQASEIDYPAINIVFPFAQTINNYSYYAAFWPQITSDPTIANLNVPSYMIGYDPEYITLGYSTACNDTKAPLISMSNANLLAFDPATAWINARFKVRMGARFPIGLATPVYFYKTPTGRFSASIAPPSNATCTRNGGWGVVPD